MPRPEDRKLTPRENYLRLLTGQMPEWVPIYTMGAPLPDGEDIPIALVTPAVLHDPHGTTIGSGMKGELVPVKDCWGVSWVGSYETGGALLPEPGNFMLEDIEDWHDVVHAPDISDVDWESMCRKTMDALAFDPTQTAAGLNLYVGTFQEYVGMMGFTEGLVAMIEEPEEAAALCKYINDFYIEVGRKCMPYMDIDALVLMDDSASARAPFMGEDLFRQVLLPCYRDMYEQLAEPYGIPVQFHNCGACANYIEICHDEAGVTAWDPAQTMNDLVGFKEKWGREIALMGGYDAKGELLEPDCPDELIVESVHESYDLLAPEGGYAFSAGFVGPADDPKTAHKNQVLMRAAQEYGNTFYD